MKKQAVVMNDDTSQPYFKVDISDRIAILSLDNPPVNALKIALLNKLDKTIDSLSSDPEVKVILITGGQRIFSCGADIKEMSGIMSGKQARAMSSLGQNVFLSIENCSKPVIAVIRGLCLGGGLELALSCHIRIASSNAILGMPEICLGMIPAFGASFRLPQIIGKSKTIDLVLSGRKIPASEALSIGMVDLMFPKETVMADTVKYASKLTQKSGVAMRLALRSIIHGTNANTSSAMEIESSCMEELYDSHDLKEGVFAYIEKRKPEFRDC